MIYINKRRKRRSSGWRSSSVEATLRRNENGSKGHRQRGKMRTLAAYVFAYVNAFCAFSGFRIDCVLAFQAHKKVPIFQEYHIGNIAFLKTPTETCLKRNEPAETAVEKWVMWADLRGLSI